MANKLSIGLAISLLLSGSFSGLAYADSAQSALERQIMNGDASPSAGNPDNFPWMNKDGSAKPGAKSEASAAPAPTAGTPPPEPIRESAAPSPARETTTAPAKQEWPHVTMPEEKLKVEHAEVAPEHARSAESHTAAAAEKNEHGLEKATERPAEHPAETVARKPNMLYGRIEQLSAGTGASFPSLKAQTPMLDPRGALTGKATATAPLMGVIVKSFPVNYEGNWGGRLVLQQVQVDPNYYRIDPEEAKATVLAMKPGLVGSINFDFERARGAVSLEPTRALFMVPAKDTQASDQIRQMFGASSAAFGGMMSQMVSSMNVPVALEFGELQRTGLGETSVSGNQQSQKVLKNECRQLNPNTIEQQIITQETSWNKRTHVPRTEFGESVLRFTRQTPTVMYVQCATVSYDAQKKFLKKLVLYGSIGKGVVMNTDPMQAMQAATPGAAGMGGMGGLGGLQGLFGGGGAGGGQTPTIPAGGLDGMLKNLFGGQ